MRSSWGILHMRAWFIVLALYPSPKHIKRSAPRGFYTDPTLISEALWVISPSVRHSFSFNQPNVFFFFLCMWWYQYCGEWRHSTPFWDILAVFRTITSSVKMFLPPPTVFNRFLQCIPSVSLAVCSLFVTGTACAVMIAIYFVCFDRTHSPVSDVSAFWDLIW